MTDPTPPKTFGGDLDAAMSFQEDQAKVTSAFNRRTHAANAERLAAREKNHLMYVTGLGWYEFDGPRWKPDDTDAPIKAMVRCAREAIFADAQLAFDLASRADADSEKRIVKMAEAIKRHARDSEQTPHINSSLTQAQGQPQLRVQPDDLDANPDVINTQSGLLDLKAFELRKPEPGDRVTKTTAASYDPDAPADAPKFRAFVARILPDPEERAYLQRFAGQALTGHRLEEFLNMTGDGANGKSTLQRCFREALGEYAALASPDVFVAHGGRRTLADMEQIAVLRGARLATSDEIEKGQRLAEARLKQLTEPYLTTQRKFERQTTHRNVTTFMISSNYKPEIRSVDEGIWRRVRILEFGVQIPEDERDELFFEKHLAAEIDGVFAWMVEGLRDFRERGDKTDPPASVVAATRKYREQSDLVATWLEEKAELTGNTDDAESYDALWRSFDEYAKAESSGKNDTTKREFGERFEKATKLERKRPKVGGKQLPWSYTGVRLMASTVPALD